MSTQEAKHLVATTGFNLSPLSTLTPTAAHARSILSMEGYTRIGDVPAGINWGPADLAKVGEMIKERAACRAAKEYERADELKEELRVLGGDAWGIKVRDAERTWYVSLRTAQSRQRSTLIVHKPPKGASAALYEEGRAVVRQREERLAMLHARTKPIDERTPVEGAPESEEMAPASVAAIDPNLVAPPPPGFSWGVTY